MLKKLFRSLTQSKEERFIHESETLAESLARSSPQSAKILRQVASLMRMLESSSNDSKRLNIEDLDDLAMSICEALRERTQVLAKLESELPLVISSADGRRFDAHMDQWRNEAATIMRGYSRLRHAITGQAASGLESLGSDQQTKLNAALESLELEIRTTERIQNELG